MTRDGSDENRLNEAIAWHVRLQDAADEAAWVAFSAWLEADSANRVTFDRVEEIDGDIDDLLRTVNPSMIALSPKAKPSTSFPFAPLAAAAAIAAVVLITLFFERPPDAGATEYTTAAEEMKTLALNDGSKIILNARTSLSVDSTGHTATLHRGEALFRIVHDPAHPFAVRAGDRVIHDIGTTFDVSRNAGLLRVVVAEGRVGVAPIAVDAKEIDVTAGFELSLSEGDGEPHVRATDAADATAWQKGFLVYHNARLDEIVNDLNRFYATPIVLGKGTDRHFSGVLKLDDENATVARLATFLRLKITRTTDGRIGLQDARAAP